MTRLSTRPFERLLRLQGDLQRALGTPSTGIDSSRGVFPHVNIFNSEDGIVLRAEVPGFKSDDIELTVEPHTLSLKGARSADQFEKPGSYHRRERQHGSFARTIALPRELDVQKADAECKHGLLTIRIPKAESAKPKQIQVKTAA